MRVWSYHVTLCLLAALRLTWGGLEDAPPPLPISEHEFPRSTVNPVPYRGAGLWKQPPDDVDVGFVPQKTYSQVRRTSRVVHLPQSDALESASDAEEVINAPRLREVVKHTQVREVYEEEGFEDNAYDHAGYKKAAEHQSGYKKGDEPENKRWRRQRRKPKVDSQGQQSEEVTMKHADKEETSGEYEGKGDGAIEGSSEMENGSKEAKKGRGRGRYKFNSGDGGEDDDGNRNYSYGRMMHTMDVKRGVEKMDDKGRRIEGNKRAVERKRTKKPRGNFLVNGFGEVIKNQARKRESPMEAETVGADVSTQGSKEESGSGQGSLEDSFSNEHSATDRPDKAEYLEAADEERRLKEEDAIREEEIEQHYLETSADIAKDYVKEDRGIDHRKYPYYKTTKNKHSPLRYAMSSSEIPQKTAGGLEFYDSKDFYHCEEVKGPVDVTPVRQKDGQWAGAPRKGIFPRLSGLGDKIDCFKNKYWGKEPLDSPFFKEDESVAAVENKKRDTQSDSEEKSSPFEDSSGFYADIVGNIRNIEQGNFPETNFDSGGPTTYQRPQQNIQSFKPSFERPTRDNERDRYQNHRDGEESDDSEEDDDRNNDDHDDNGSDRDERPEESETPPYPKYITSAPVYEQVYTNPQQAQPLYKYKLLPVKTKRNHHHIILNILPPIKQSKKKDKKLPKKNNHQVKAYPKPTKTKGSSYPPKNSYKSNAYPKHTKTKGSSYPSKNIYKANAYSNPSKIKASSYPPKNSYESNAYSKPTKLKASSHPQKNSYDSNAYSKPIKFKASSYPLKNSHAPNTYPKPIQIETSSYPLKNTHAANAYQNPIQIEASSYPLYPPLGNENQRPTDNNNYRPAKYYPIRPSQVAEYQASSVNLPPDLVNHQEYASSRKPVRSPRPIPINYSTPIKSTEEFVNIFGLYPPPPNLHFKYQTLTLLAPNTTTARFRRPEPVQSAHASNVVRKYPMVDNMAQETYDVVAKVSNLTEQQLRNSTKHQSPNINVKLRVKRSRSYSEIKPVREDVDEDDEPRVIRKRKRPRKKEPWRNDDAAVEEERRRPRPSHEEEIQEDTPVTSPPRGSYDVHEDFDDSVHPFHLKDFDFPDEGDYSRDSRPQAKKSKQYSAHNHRPDAEHVKDDTLRQPEAASGHPEEIRSRKRKPKRRRKKPKKKNFWRNEESYEHNEKEPNVEKYVEWKDSDEITEVPIAETQVDKVDEVPSREVKSEEKSVEDKRVGENKRRRRPSKRVRIPKPRPPVEEVQEEQEEDTDADSRRETRRKVEPTSRPYSTHGSLTDRINGWLSDNKDLEIISLDANERMQPTEKNERRDSKPQVNESDEIPDEEASSSEQTEVTVNYPNVSRNNYVVKKSLRKGETVKSERGKVDESNDQEGSQSKNSREKSTTSEEERYSTDKRRGEPKYKEVEVKKGADTQKNNTHMTIHEEIRLTPLNAPPPIVLSPAEINARLATLFKDQKYGSRYNAKEPQESVNTLRKLRPDEPDSEEKVEESSEDDVDVQGTSTTTSKTTTTTTAAITSLKPRVRAVFSTRSRSQGSNETKEIKPEPKSETLRSKTQFSQRARGRSRDWQTTTEKSDEIAVKESQSQRTKARESPDASVKEVTRSRIRRPTVKSNAEATTTQQSTVVKPRSRYRFSTTTKTTPVASNENSSPRLDGRKLSRKGRDKPTTELPVEVKVKDQKKEGSEAGEVSKEEDVSTIAPATSSTTKAPKRIFLFNRPKPTTTVKPEVTTKRVITIERPKKPVDILSKFESTNLTSTSRHKTLSKIPSADIKKVESKSPLVLGSKSITKLTQNRGIKVGDSNDDRTKPRQLQNFETRKVTQEEIFTTSYTPQDDDNDEEGEEDGEENDDEDGDNEYADESENDDVTYEPFEHPYFKFEQNNEQSKKVERFENPTSGWGSDHSGVNRNSIKGRIHKKGYLKPQESLARQTLATDRTLTYIVDPLTRIGTWVEGRS